MISCEINENRVMPSSICADLFDGDDFAEWTSLVDARLIGKVKGADGILYVVVNFESRERLLTDVINSPAGTWMLEPHEARMFNFVQ